MALKDILMAPGPSQVPDRVRLKLAEPAWYHRSARFKKLYQESRERLGRIFETKSDVALFAGSGTVAMEASIVNVVAPDRKAVVVTGGKWGERLVKIFESFNINKTVIKVEYGLSPTPEQVADAAKDPAVSAVYIHLCETSTGAKYDVKGIGEAVRKVNPGALLAVDAISGAVGMECPLDAWGVDLFMAGSQKGLMMPPGLAVLTISPKAWSVIEKIKAPSYYASLNILRKDLAAHDTPFTPANTLISALNEALKMIEEEGPKNVLARHALLAKATQAGTAALGLELFPKHPAEVLTVVRAPGQVDMTNVMKAARDRYGVTLADGQGEMKGKVLRIAHMGYCSAMDSISAIAALEFGLKANGAAVKLGTGVAAAQEVIAAAPKDVWL
jgi:aspartate aminotransferase-like enzyme